MAPQDATVNPVSRLAGNLDDVRRRIDAAARRAGRDPADVRLVVVTKGHAVSHLAALPGLGVTDLGENRIQEAAGKIAASDLGVRWHLIGHLQRNKARRAVSLFALIHSLDSLRLLDHLDRIAGETGTAVEALLQVNVSGEPQKHGLEPGEVRSVLGEAASRTNVTIRGFMGMAPFGVDAEICRSCFSDLARIRREASEGAWYRISLPELSMGMTGDFEIAVEEGATIVRVGTAVFRGVDPAPDDAPPGRNQSRNEER
ncbi:MAG: YggS family pyridoxal phosphate-dependent enzyme [Planctomycetota bacterium]